MSPGIGCSRCSAHQSRFAKDINFQDFGPHNFGREHNCNLDRVELEEREAKRLWGPLWPHAPLKLTYVDRHIWAWPCLNKKRETERFRDKELHCGDEIIGICMIHARVSCCRTKHPLVWTSQRGGMGNRMTGSQFQQKKDIQDPMSTLNLISKLGVSESKLFS